MRIDNYGQRIVNGQDAREKEFPWMAMLIENNPTDYFCGATLIHKEWLLTAAHCVVPIGGGGDQMLPNEFVALLGMYHTYPKTDKASHIQEMEISRFSFYLYMLAENTQCCLGNL